MRSPEIADPGANVGSPEDDRLVPVYNRRPESFGLDRYRLDQSGRERCDIRRRGALGRAEPPTGNPHRRRNRRPRRNVSRESRLRAARKRSEPDRRARRESKCGHVRPRSPVQGSCVHRERWSGSIGFPRPRPSASSRATRTVNRSRACWSCRRSIRAPRPYARLRAVIRASCSPARSTRGCSSVWAAVDIVFDVYNLPGFSYSVEELTTEAPNVRVTTAMQPPRTVHVGLRLTF